MNALVRTTEETRDVTALARKHPGLVTLVYPAAVGPFYLIEDDVMRHYLDAGYVGDVLQATTTWYTPFFGLGSMYAPAARWLGAHARVFGYRRDLDAPPFEGPRGRAVKPQVNGAIVELSSGAIIDYRHTTFADASGTARFEIRGTAGVLVCIAAGAGAYSSLAPGATGTVLGARHGEELRALPVPAGVSATGPVIEAEFIAAVRGEREASPAVPRFWDALGAVEFTDAWRESVDGGGWRDVPQP